MKIGYVVGWLNPSGFGVGSVVALNGRENLVAKEAGTGKLTFLVRGEAFKTESCGGGGEFANTVRKATGVAVYSSPLDLTNETLYLPDGTIHSGPEAAPELETEVVEEKKKTLRSLRAFKLAFGAEVVDHAVKQIKNKKAFTAIPREYRADLKALLA